MRAIRTALYVALLVASAASIQTIRAQSPRFRVYASGLTSPVAFVQDPTNSTVQFVVEQAGRIRVVQSGVVQPTDFLDLRGAILAGGERGLLGMATAPDYASSGRFFVNFTNPQGHTVVARFRRSANPLVADPASRVDLQWPSGLRYIEQPYSNHNAGDLAFGPDGYLYIGLGDGGSGNDPENRAQNPAELLGKMLRIDVNVPDSNTRGYVVPSTNPFVSGGPAGVLPEIWSFGLRNPWRYSFDLPSRGGTGALIIADVGQGAWEEVDYEPANRGGRNYGWRYREGAHDNVISPPPVYNPSNLINPIHEYGRSVGQSITGGFVYRGAARPAYRGRYFFADYVQGRVWSIALTINASGEATASTATDHTAELGGAAVLGSISAFGLDASGELYMVSHTRGQIVQMISDAPPSPPTNLRIIR
jgi:glucose/arabinose dehydrogenase